MKTWMLAPVAASLVLVFWLGHALATPQEGMQMPAWMKLGEEHAEMAKSTGKFTVKGKVWMAPGMPAMEFEGKATSKMILNGRYLEEVFTADVGGVPLEGRLIQGYDTIAKEYFAIWMDNSNPIASTNRGKMVDGVLKMTGEAPHPMTGQPKKTRSEVKHEGKTTTFTMWDVLPEGKSFKTTEMVYTKSE